MTVNDARPMVARAVTAHARGILGRLVLRRRRISAGATQSGRQSWPEVSAWFASLRRTYSLRVGSPGRSLGIERSTRRTDMRVCTTTKGRWASRAGRCGCRRLWHRRLTTERESSRRDVPSLLRTLRTFLRWTEKSCSSARHVAPRASPPSKRATPKSAMSARPSLASTRCCRA